MSVLIQIRDACKRYGDQVLLDRAEATLVAGSKVGFVGRNGAGKSTLLRVLLGEEELDAGEVNFHPRVRLGYLRQHDPFLADESGIEFLMRDSGQPDWKCGAVAGQFELKGDKLTCPIGDLSGGWQTRVKLAALLLHDPNLLLLDEPTNFLDLRTQILLEHFLARFRHACLIVSHDREFLAATCSQTLDLSRGRLTMYPGRIGEFLSFQQERREHDQRVNATVLAKQKQLKRFIDKNRANASTASQARSKAKQLQRLELNEIEVEEAAVRIRAPVVEARQGTAIRCEDLRIGYEERVVATGVSFEVEHGERAAVVGDNGQGKTTLLRTLVDSLRPLGGVIRWGHGCKVGTYAQHVYMSLPADRTVLEYLEHRAQPGTTNQDLLAQAGALLFRDWQVEKKIGVLSGGERARVCLAGLLLGSYNVLIMDEPGNHLDVRTVEILADALTKYRGTLVFTSHDRHFMRRVATSVIEVRDGRIKNYLGDYDTYLHAINKEIEAGERDELSRPPETEAQRKPRSDRSSRQDQRVLRKETNNIERKIARLDEEKRELDRQLLATADADEAIRLHDCAKRIGVELAEAEQRWCELQEAMSELEEPAG